MVFCDVDDALARNLRASLLLQDDDLELHALTSCAVDRLMGGECLVEQLDDSQPHKKKRRVDGDDNDTEDDDNKLTTSPAAVCDGMNISDCDATDRDTATTNETDCDDNNNHDNDDDDDGADALLAELGNGTWHIDDDEFDEVAAALRVVSSQEKRLLRADSCCSTLSLVGGTDDDLFSAPPSSSKSVLSSSAAAPLPPCTCSQPSAVDTDDVLLQRGGAKQYLDLHVRYGVHVRVADVDIVDGHSQFTLRVQDSETKRAWDVKKSSAEMVDFYRQVRKISADNAPVKRDLCGSFRSLRRIHLPKGLFRLRGALLHQRKVVFDSFLRQTAALVSPAPLGPRRRRAVLLLQEFCGVHRHVEVFDRTRRSDNNCDAPGASATCERCGVVAPAQHPRVTARQLVAELFATPSHDVFQDCAAFVATLTRSSNETRRSKLTDRKARAILKAIARKMTEFKRRMLDDATLRRQLLAARAERMDAEDDADADDDDFVDALRHAVCTFVEQHVMVPLEDHVLEALHTVCPHDDEMRLRNKLRVMAAKDASYFGVPPHLASPDNWFDARQELERLRDYTLPLDKLKCIVRSASAIFRSCMRCAEASPSLGPAVTTDEFIAINLYVVVQSAGANSQLLVTKELLRLMCDYHDATGEIGYYLTNFEAAIEIVERHHDPLRPMF